MNKDNYKNRLYGRTKGRSKKKININYYNELLSKFKFREFNQKKNYILDIGTGYGETTIYLSNKFLNKTVIACEKYINGNLNLFKEIKYRGIKNIELYPGNINDILQTSNKKKYFDMVWIFFPDPWPKKRHFKRRLVNEEFLKRIYHFMNLKSRIYIVTDSVSYTYSIIKDIYKAKNHYKWINQNLLYLSLKDYYNLETKYYKKAIISGKKPSILILEKI